jgi:hypothetical protein
MRTLTLLPLIMTAALAQETVAPTPEQTGPVRGADWSGYNIVNSFEVGYRFAQTGGNSPMYRSVVNYGNGVRLLNSYLSMNAKDAAAGFLDEVVITTQGLGNDPYESATVRLKKRRFFRYDLLWRLNDYVNPGLVTDGGGGANLLDTRYRMQDHDLTLFPESNLKFFFGYTGSSQTGPAFSSVQLFDSRGSIFPLFTNVHRIRNEYRVGNEFRLFGVRINWVHGWDNFKDDANYSLPPAGSALTNFQRQEPYHGNSPYWRVALFKDHKIVNVSGRFTYTSGQRRFVVDEQAAGPGVFGRAQDRQVVTFGDAQRPVATGNFDISFFPASKLTVVNSTSLYNIRTAGDAYYAQFDQATLSFDVLNYRYLGIRTFSNDTEVSYQFSPVFGSFGGYQYSTRHIGYIEQSGAGGFTDRSPFEQDNQLHQGRVGFRIRPVKPFNILVSGEIGRNNRPFTPIADRDYHALNARLQYRTRAFLLSAGADSDYRFNSVTLSSFSARARNYFASGSWSPNERLSFDGSFTRSRLYTIGGIVYFSNFNQVSDTSIFVSNLNTVTGGVRLALIPRADLYLAYSRVQDLADNRPSPQTFPVLYESPLARLSVRISEKLRWNAGYQYYGYREKFFPNQNFRANTGYSSISWSF